MKECRPLEPLGLIGRFRQWLPFEVRIVKIEDEERKKLKRQERTIIIVVFATASATILLATLVSILFLPLVSFIPIFEAYLEKKKAKKGKSR